MRVFVLILFNNNWQRDIQMILMSDDDDYVRMH